MYRRLTREEGFSLIEILVVVLVLGILAAIALPVLTAQRRKGQDTDARSNVRNAAVHMEACVAATESYAACPFDASANTGLPIGTSQGEVQVSSQTVTGYVATGYSRSGCNYVITKSSSSVARTTSGSNCPAATW